MSGRLRWQRARAGRSSARLRLLAVISAAVSVAMLAAACGGSQPERLDVGAATPGGPSAEVGSGYDADGEVGGDGSVFQEPAPDLSGSGSEGTASSPSKGKMTRRVSGSAGGSAPSGTPVNDAAPRGTEGTGSAGTATGGTPKPPGGPGTPPAPGNQAPADNGGATDVGVSGNSVKFGSISGNNTPLGNLISQPVTTAVFAAMRAINDAGGVYGRKLQIVDCDDAGDVTRFRACYRKLVEEEKIFSFITSITWGTGEVHGDLARDKIPWIGSWGFYTSEWKDPWMFPVHLATIHEAHADAIWVRDIVKPDTVGILHLNSPEQHLAKQALHEILDPAGIEVVREIPQEIDSADESANVLAMRAANPDHVIHFSWPPPMIKWMIDAAQQGYWPPKGVSGNHLIGEQVGRLVGDWPIQGNWSVTSYRSWSDSTEYLATVEKYAPQMHKLHHHLTQSGFVGVKITAEALKALGPNLTRDGLMKVLESRTWDMGPGMGQEVLWGAGNHDTMRCEYQYKYNSSDTGSFKVFVPDPDRFRVCDDFD